MTADYPAAPGLVPSLELVLWTTDVPALAAFLATVAGADVLEQHPGYARLSLAGTPLTLHADEAYDGHPWFDALHYEGAARGIGAELRLQVPEAEDAYRTALRAGATIVYPPHDQEGARECQVMAPDGYLLTLWSPLVAPG